MATPHGAKYSREATRVKALRPLRGAPDAALTQAFLPVHFSAMWGMGRCESQSSQPEAMTDVFLNTTVGDPLCLARLGGN
jgi:hypothetical protein